MDLKKHYTFGLTLLQFTAVLGFLGLLITAIYQYFI